MCNPPEEWRALDEANPGLFQYQMSFMGQTFEGNYVHRVFTVKELIKLRETSKKGGKKDEAIDE